MERAYLPDKRGTKRGRSGGTGKESGFKWLKMEEKGVKWGIEREIGGF
jgi:hypothetical protein